MISSFFEEVLWVFSSWEGNLDPLILEGISHSETKVTSSSDKSGAIPRKRVAIYGGTFDPPTNSHMNLDFKIGALGCKVGGFGLQSGENYIWLYELYV